MGQLEGKCWGNTESIITNNVLEFHKIHVNKNGYCSKHRHNHKINFFYVQEGKLLIRIWKNSYDLIDETIINSGEYTSIEAGEFHQFEALEDTIAFEIYWTETINHNDIERESIGGNKE